MIQAIAEYSWDKLGAGTDLSVKPGDDPIEVLRKGCAQWIPTNPDDAPYLRVHLEVFFHSIDDPSLTAAMEQVDGSGLAQWKEIVRAAQATGQIDPSRDPEDVVSNLWAMTDGLLLGAAGHPKYFTKKRLIRLWDQAFDAIVTWSPAS